MKLTIEGARALAERSMVAVGHTQEEAQIIADHLIDCELRGVEFGGLARALSIIEHITETTPARRPIIITQETSFSASIRGGAPNRARLRVFPTRRRSQLIDLLKQLQAAGCRLREQPTRNPAARARQPGPSALPTLGSGAS